MSFIERQDIEGVISGSENGDRGIREADAERPVFCDDPSRFFDIILIECRQLVGFPSDLSEKERLGIDAAELLNEIVSFRKNER